ncbi:MAG: hypothetical protein JWQ23_2273 [Herminiimonas sp.]|nr:hypothetical protein [Herminiimonas sp.]
MKKLVAAVFVVLVAGCSGMHHTITSGGMGSGTMSSGSANMGTDPSRGPIADPNTRDVIDTRTGNLTLYHGG